jgi:[ribosomal protein S5]-alanine N-acetyltransferase
MEENFVDFKCPYCGQTVSFPANVAGRVQKCPNCPESMLVPAESGAVGGKLPVSLNTQRLILRRFNAGDWKPLLEVMSNADLLKYTEWNSVEEVEVEQWIDRDREIRLLQERDYFLSIELAAESAVVGLAGIHFREDLRQAEFTIVINPKYQRQGIGAEAANGLLDFLFSGLNLHRVSIACDARNEAGRRLLRKAGFRLEGEFLKDYMVKNEWADHAWYAVLADEYAGWPETRKKAELNF